MNFIVGISSCPQSVGVKINLSCSVKLEGACTIVDKFFEMLKPFGVDVGYLIKAFAL